MNFYEVFKRTYRKSENSQKAEELLAMAKAENIEMTAEEAAKYFAELHKTGELSDEELDNVAGGCGGEEITEPKYKEGDLVWISGGFACYTCGRYRAFKVTEVHRSPVGKHTYSVACPDCGEKWWNANVEEDSVDLISNSHV